MCGILFSHDETRPREEHLAACGRALEAIRHRGPDEEGLIDLHPVVVGHRRLSIIDPSGSRQPIADESGRYLLTYNGEIYNYRDLRARLRDRWRFRTEGDTEVLLAGLVREGVDFIDRMEGMWAFALWDNRTRELLLARDRMGEKPLYFFHDEHRGTFCCGSEIPSLIEAIGKGRVTEDEASTADYLRYGYFLPGYTIYREVREVLPGHRLHWSPRGPATAHRYWRIRPKSRALHGNRAMEELRALFTDSVSKRFVSDVEVGAFLSGGVDSSLVAATATRTLKREIKAFTIGFHDKSFDESAHARAMADHAGVDHRLEYMDYEGPDELNRLTARHLGQPFGDASLLPTARVSKLAAASVKVALSGDGGDELFSGYQRYQARALMRWYTRLPKPLRSNCEKAIGLLPENTRHHSRSLLKKAHLFVGAAQRIESETPYVAPMQYSNRVLRRLIPDLWQAGKEPPELIGEYAARDVERMMFADALVYLPQDILQKVDRAAMAHSLETRPPFLDHRLVELAFNVPLSQHRTAFSGKAMLKRAFRDLLPDGVWRRRKQGFGVPLGEWFRGELGREMGELNRTLVTPLDRRVVDDMLERHRDGRVDNGLRLWQLYCYMKWKDEQT